MRQMTFRRGDIRAAALPRSDIYSWSDSRAYAVTLHYSPREDRISAGYSVGVPLLPTPMLVAQEDPLEGLWVDPAGPLSQLVKDLPLARRFLMPQLSVEEAAAAVAADRLISLLKEMEALL